MKTYFTSQDSVIANYGHAFAEYIYDTFYLDSYFRQKDIHFPPFTGLKSKPAYQRMLLAWMIEQASDCIEKTSAQLYHIPPFDRSPLEPSGLAPTESRSQQPRD